MGRRSKSLFEHETRRRLIDAAGSLFAEKGYSSTTVQDICEKAEANISAVNYHFGSKMKLYEATLQYTLLKDQESSPPRKGKKTAPDESLYQLVLDMIKNVRLTDKPEWFPLLLRREIMFPTAEFQDFIQRLIKQDFERISALITEILPHARPYDVKICALTLLEQVKGIAMESDIVLQDLFPELELNGKGYERLARHITDTAIAGILAVYADKPAKAVKR